MIASQQVVQAIRNLTEQLRELPLPEKTEEVTALVVQQQQLLEAYIQSAGSGRIDHKLIRDVMRENHRLLAMTKQAHTDAAEELDALALGRSAISAYQDLRPN